MCSTQTTRYVNLLMEKTHCRNLIVKLGAEGLIVYSKDRLGKDYKYLLNSNRARKELDWKKRLQELEKILTKHKNKSIYDCIIPVSGGKDGTYVTDQLKTKYNIRPLCVTVKPALELNIGKKNLDNFLKEGVDHIHVTPNLKAMSILDRIGFLDYGQGYYGWTFSRRSFLEGSWGWRDHRKFNVACICQTNTIVL